MRNTPRLIVAALTAVSLALAGGTALAQPKPKDQKEHQQGGKQDKDKKPKKVKHQNGKSLVGDKVKQNGQHKIHQNGKHTAYVDVKDGKIAGMKVKHAEKGDVPVKKYKTRKNPMTAAAPSGFQPVSMMLAQQQYLGETWIGYSYIDEWGEEVIYWYPYDMIYDGDTGAIEYVPVYD